MQKESGKQKETQHLLAASDTRSALASSDAMSASGSTSRPWALNLSASLTRLTAASSMSIDEDAAYSTAESLIHVNDSGRSSFPPDVAPDSSIKSVKQYLSNAITSAGRYVQKSFHHYRNRNTPQKPATARKLEHGGGMSWHTLEWEYSQHEANPDDDEEGEAGDSWLPRISIPVFHDRKPFVGIWDMIMLALIGYTGIAVPYQAVFGRFIIWDGWFIFHVVLDIMFTLDMILQFNISYYSMRRQVTVLSRKNIVTRYLQGSFTADLISVIPFDLMARGIEGNSSHPGSLAVRICSLVKMMRLMRLGRIVRRVEASNPINYGVWTMLTFVLMTVVLSHWVACIWGMVALFEIYTNPDNDDNWMFDIGKEYGLQWNQDSLKFEKAPLEDGSDSLIDTDADFYLYTAALYFAVYSLASVGYGDMTPVSDVERYICCAIMLLGAYFLGYIVASITSVVATRNADSAEYYRLMDQLNKFMDEHQLEKDLRSQLRAYFHYRKQTNGMHSWHSVIAQMSPNLRREVFAHTSCQLIQDVEFFRNCDTDGAFIMDLGMCLESNTYTPREKIINIDDEADNMYIVRRGVCASEGNIYMRQGVFGMDMLEGMIHDIVPMRNYMAIALTYSDVLLISSDSLHRVMMIHPDASEVIRHRILKRIMQLEVRAYTSAMSQILTGRRPYWTRLRGDPGGREQFYHEKLVAITPTEENYDLYIEKVAAACTIQRAVRNLLRIRRLQRTWMRPPSNMAIRSALEAKTQAAKQKITRTLSFVRPRSSKNLPANKTVSMEDLPPSTLSEVKSGEGAAAAGVDQWQDVLTEVEDLMSTLDNVSKARSKLGANRRSTLQF